LATVRTATPEPGANSDEVLAELGYPPAEIDGLREQGAI
jgi:crotonobetainyl-CoA:carnitine CoA-transferase CaiB-like acyl-CoA transferase